MNFKCFFFTCVAALSFCPHSANAQWVPGNGAIGVIDCFAASGINLFAGTWGGAWCSTDNGSNWTQVFSMDAVSALAVLGNNLFAATSSDVFLSTDNGTNWEAVNNNMGRMCKYSLAVSGEDLFVGTCLGVYMTSNSGNEWHSVSAGLPLTNNDSLVGIGALFSDGRNLYAGITYAWFATNGQAVSGDVFLSTDNGEI